jgi:thymidylate synthase
VTSAADFRALGCKVWDQNANENAQWLANPFREGVDDLGPIYGASWRSWPAFKMIPLDDYDKFLPILTQSGWKELGFCKEEGQSMVAVFRKEIDQLGDCVRKIILTPSDRRILFHGWNPATLDQLALPSCHLLYQFHPNEQTKELSLSLYIRSNDMFLGNPLNVAEAGMLMHLVGRLTGYTPKILSVFIGDAHIYENHLDQVREQLKREPYPAPKLMIDSGVPTFQELKHRAIVPDSEPWPATQEAVLKSAAELAVQRLSKVEPIDFMLPNYQHHEALTAPMAV